MEDSTKNNSNNPTAWLTSVLVVSAILQGAILVLLVSAVPIFDRLFVRLLAGEPLPKLSQVVFSSPAVFFCLAIIGLLLIAVGIRERIYGRFRNAVIATSSALLVINVAASLETLAAILPVFRLAERIN